MRICKCRFLKFAWWRTFIEDVVNMKRIAFKLVVEDSLTCTGLIIDIWRILSLCTGK